MPSIFEATAGKLIGPTNGGSVTQATNKSTAVTLNTESGVITTNNAALADAAEVTFQVNNDKVTATDIPQIAIASGGTAGAYLATVSAVAAGSFKVSISNFSAALLTVSLRTSFSLTLSSSNFVCSVCFLFKV